MTFGVDFGTSNSVVARWDGQTTRVVPVDSANVPAQWRLPEFEQLFPSVLGVRRLQNTLSFGWDAKTASAEPVDAVKRMLGTRAADRSVALAEANDDHLGQSHVWIGNENYSSTVAAAALFHRMRAGAEEQLLDLSEAVVTVPANATGGARYRTRAAARLAGIKVKALINEPTAAALSYAYDVPGEGRFLVFDWGGGTIDVTILEYSDGTFEEQASRGIAALGGLELDEALAALILDKLGETPQGLLPAERRRWRREVELTKIALAQGRPEVLFDSPRLQRPVPVSQREFRQTVAPLIDRALEPVERVLKDLAFDPEDIDSVLLVGGTSQLPQVRQALGGVFKPDRIVDSRLCPPMTAVARGAAIFAAALDGILPDTDIVLAASYDLGVAFEAGARKGFRPIIRRRQTLTAGGESTFTPAVPYADSVTVELVEGEVGYPADSDRAFPLARIRVPLPQPERDPSENRIKIKFRYDRSGLLKFTAIHERTGRELARKEVDSFGADGTPLEHGLDTDFARFLSRTTIPFPQPTG